MNLKCQLQSRLAVALLSVVSRASYVLALMAASCSLSHTPQPIGSAHNYLRFEHHFLPVFAFIVIIHSGFYGLGLRAVSFTARMPRHYHVLLVVELAADPLGPPLRLPEDFGNHCPRALALSGSSQTGFGPIQADLLLHPP